MELLVISENPLLYSSQRIISEATSMGLHASNVNPYLQHLFIGQGHKKKRQIVLHRTTGIRHDDFDLAYSTQLQYQGAAVFNRPEILARYRDKQAQIVELFNISIPTIPSYSFRGPLPKDMDRQLQQLFGKFYSDQFIVKTSRGNQGIGVNFVQGMTSLKSILETFHAINDQKFIIQPFLAESIEYRYFFIAGQIIGVLKRLPSTHDVRKNFKRSTTGDLDSFHAPSEMEPQITQMALDTYNRTGIFYGAIDIIECNSHKFLLEMNLVPGFKQFEELSRINIAKMIICSCINEVSHDFSN